MSPLHLSILFLFADKRHSVRSWEDGGEQNGSIKLWKVSYPSLLTSLDTRSSFSPHCFQRLIWPLFWQVLLDRVVCQVRALVVLPTKELAQQVHNLAPQLLLTEQNWAEGRADAGNILSGCSGCSLKTLSVGLMLLMGSITFSDFVVANKAHLFAGE